MTSGKEHSDRAEPGSTPWASGSSASSSNVTRSQAQIHRRPDEQKRAQVQVACVECQRKKSKCDGNRPSCSRCGKSGTLCEYDTDAGVSRSTAMRRRNDALQNEIHQLREFLAHIRSCREVEAEEIFRHLRTTNESQDLNSLARPPWFRLSQAHTKLRPTARPENIQWNAPASDVPESPARPWTSLADEGMVRELVLAFFAHDHCSWIPFVDQDCFLAEMSTGNTGRAKYCSPFLVNAICALRSCTSEHAKTFGATRGVDAAEHFYAEAKHLFDHENGRRSLPTVQGLLIMFAYNVGKGRDKAGTIFRLAAYDMLGRLNLKGPLSGVTHDKLNQSEQRALSRALWGIYCFESISAFAYLEPSLVQRPIIPRSFANHSAIDPELTGLDENRKLPLSVYALDAMCDLSELLYRVMVYNRQDNARVDSKSDIDTRIKFYRELAGLMQSTIPALRPDGNLTTETCFLGLYQDLLALSIFRPLRPGQQLPGEYITPEAVCLQHCELTLNSSEKFWKTESANSRSMLTLFPLYNCVATLLCYSRDQHSHGLLDRAGSMLRHLTNDFPLASFLLQGLEVVMGLWKLRLPLSSALCYPAWDNLSEPLLDVPIGFILPLYREIYDGNDSVHETKMEFGRVVSEGSNYISCQK